MKILISAVACGFGRGSEPGVGWNVASALAERHEVTVLTSSRCKADNDRAVTEGRCGFDLVYRDHGGTDQSVTSRQAVAWHHAMLQPARALVRERGIDIAYHATFNQYRIPFVASRLGIPFVIGPIGGAETIPPVLLGELPPLLRCKEVLRSIPLDVYLHRLWRDLPAKPPGHLFCSCPATARRMKRVWPQGVIDVMPAIAVASSEIHPAWNPDRTASRIIYAGRILPEKGLKPLLRAFRKALDGGVSAKCSIVGVRSEADSALLEQMRREAGVPAEVLEIVPFMPRADLMDLMRDASAVVYPAFRDSGSMAVLEALATGAWPICLDISSQHWLPADLARKIPTDSQEQVVENLASAMVEAIDQKPRSETWNARRTEFLHKNMTWSARAARLESVFEALI
jgi:glycosyltransferase involved in cell wall biosynthesis